MERPSYGIRLRARLARAVGAGLLAVQLSAPPAAAAGLFDSAKLLATGGVSQLEGAGGGGLSAWALITGYGTRDSIGANVHYTHANLPDFTFHAAGAAAGLYDRVELSYARQWFDTGAAGGRLGLGEGFTFHQDILGAKLKLFGDAVYDQDSWIPQTSLGLQYKKNDRGAVIQAVGGRSDEGTDFYLAASKLFLAHSLLANGAVRLTKANQFGLLGFGGDASNSYSLQFEGALAYLVSRKLAIGAELRTKPDNLRFAAEDDAFDVFAAYFLNKHASLTLAYVDLGAIALQGKQRGVYLSLQAGF